MKRNQTRMIIGTAISAAAIAVAVDHTRQRLPKPEEQLASQEAVIIIDEGEELPDENNMDCGKSVAHGRRGSPCSL
ncbi:MAG TPA: hypothetical protein DDW55_03140 [Gammaproteobacteria bacterium]|nr:hypothetical protein [Gammaproteobacteria bacterium]